jgi:hypothetical protein
VIDFHTPVEEINGWSITEVQSRARLVNKPRRLLGLA